jgi:hypothetical protein
MTNEQIKNYFGTEKVYQFAGTRNEFELFMSNKGIDYNILVANYGGVYFVCPHNDYPTDEKITEIE